MDGTAVLKTHENFPDLPSKPDPANLGALYDAYAQRVYVYIRYRVEDASAAEDLVAQTFEHALSNLKNYAPERGPFVAWLFGIARNTVSNHYRSKQKRFTFRIDSLPDQPAEQPVPEDAIIQAQEHLKLLDAVARLHEHERDLLGLKFVAGLNNRQIAAVLRKSESNVGVMLYRTIKKLKEILDDHNS